MDEALSVLIKVAPFFLSAIDPKLLIDCVEIVRNTPTATYTVEDEPFSLRVAVLNLLTESHVDKNERPLRRIGVPKEGQGCREQN